MLPYTAVCPKPLRSCVPWQPNVPIVVLPSSDGRALPSVKMKSLCNLL